MLCVGTTMRPAELTIQTRRCSNPIGVSAMSFAMRARYLTALLIGLGLILAGAIETGIHQRQAHQSSRFQTYTRNK
jgi:hypothetical protein